MPPHRRVGSAPRSRPPRRRRASRAAGRRRGRSVVGTGRAARSLSGRMRSSWRISSPGASTAAAPGSARPWAPISAGSSVTSQCSRAHMTCICSAQSSSTGSSSHAPPSTPVRHCAGVDGRSHDTAPRSSMPVDRRRCPGTAGRGRAGPGTRPRQSSGRARGRRAAARRPAVACDAPDGAAGRSAVVRAAALGQRDRHLERRQATCAAGGDAHRRAVRLVDRDAVEQADVPQPGDLERRAAPQRRPPPSAPSRRRTEAPDGRRRGGRRGSDRRRARSAGRASRPPSERALDVASRRPAAAPAASAGGRRRSPPRPRPCARGAAPRPAAGSRSSIGISATPRLANWRCTSGETMPVAAPRTPVDRDDARRPAAVELLGELVEDLAGGGVVGLAAVAEAARDRAEEDEEAQIVSGAAAAASVRAAPAFVASTRSNELEFLVAHELVLDHAGAVDDAVDAAVRARRRRRSARRRRPASRDVAGQVLDAGARRAQPREVLAHLALARSSRGSPPRRRRVSSAGRLAGARSMRAARSARGSVSACELLVLLVGRPACGRRARASAGSARPARRPPRR